MADIPLKGQRFAVRFLGRPWAWVWLAGSGALAGVSWYLMAFTRRDSSGDLRSWFLWSGNFLLAFFVITVLFSLRKWSVKFPILRDLGRAPPERGDEAFDDVQGLNEKIKRGAYADDRSILAAAREVLKLHRVEGMLRPELLPEGKVPATERSVRLVKKEPLGRLEPWLEMHVGLGTVACVGILLHADFALRHPIGWALFLLTMFVFVTGVIGAVLYRVLPPKQAEADPGIPFEEAGVAREAHDACLGGLINHVEDAALKQELQAILPDDAPREEALREKSRLLEQKLRVSHPAEKETVQNLLALAGTRSFLRWNTDRARRYDLWQKLWRWVHVPISVALFFFLVVHVWMVIRY